MTYILSSSALFMPQGITGAQMFRPIVADPTLDRLPLANPVDAYQTFVTNGQTNGGGGTGSFWRNVGPSSWGRPRVPEGMFAGGHRVVHAMPPKHQEFFEKLHQRALGKDGSAQDFLRDASGQVQAKVVFVQGRGFAFYPRNGAQIRLKKGDISSAAVFKEGNVLWLRDGQAIQINTQEPFQFEDKWSLPLYEGDVRYPELMPPYLLEALNHVKPGHPVDLIPPTAASPIARLSLLPAFGYCLQTYPGHAIQSVYNYGADKVGFITGPTSDIETAPKRSFMILRPGDIIQISGQDPFIVDAKVGDLKTAPIDFANGARAVFRDHIRSSNSFFQAIIKPGTAQIDMEGNLAYTVTYHEEEEGDGFFELNRMFGGPDHEILVVPDVRRAKAYRIQSRTQRVKLRLKGRPIIQIGHSHPIIINMSVLLQAKRQWSWTNEGGLNDSVVDVMLVLEYQLLGVPVGANREAVDKAFRRITRKHHPDKFIGKPESERKAAEEKFKKLSAAYHKICDAKKWRNNNDRDV